MESERLSKNFSVLCSRKDVVGSSSERFKLCPSAMAPLLPCPSFPSVSRPPPHIVAPSDHIELRTNSRFGPQVPLVHLG